MPSPKQKNVVQASSAKSVAAPEAAPASKPPEVFARSTSSHAAPEDIKPSLIRPNPRNPRRKFPQAKIEALLESINEVGMLVPLTVYEEPGDDGAQYTLLDGERRLKAATLGNWQAVPAWIAEKPSGKAANTLRMFNIHLMRDEWGDMPTTLALKEIMEETGITDDKELSRLTGLGRDTVTNMKRVLAFPQEWQDRVLNEDVPFNLLVELDKAVLKKRGDKKKAEVLPNVSEKKLRDFFLKGYDNGLVGSVVDLRNVGALIDTAASPKNTERVRKRAKDALADLIGGKISIDDAYQYGAAASIGIRQVLRDVENLPGRLNDVAASEIDGEERDRLRAALQNLQAEIRKVMKRLG